MEYSYFAGVANTSNIYRLVILRSISRSPNPAMIARLRSSRTTCKIYTGDLGIHFLFLKEARNRFVVKRSSRKSYYSSHTSYRVSTQQPQAFPLYILPQPPRGSQFTKECKPPQARKHRIHKPGIQPASPSQRPTSAPRSQTA